MDEVYNITITQALEGFELPDNLKTANIIGMYINEQLHIILFIYINIK